MSKRADDDNTPTETGTGAKRFRSRKPPKGVQMLRLAREPHMAEILERWRAAVKRNPDAWKPR